MCVFVCVCLCVCVMWDFLWLFHFVTSSYVYILMYIDIDVYIALFMYIYICVCECVRACVYVAFFFTLLHFVNISVADSVTFFLSPLNSRLVCVMSILQWRFVIFQSSLLFTFYRRCVFRWLFSMFSHEHFEFLFLPLCLSLLLCFLVLSCWLIYFSRS